MATADVDGDAVYQSSSDTAPDGEFMPGDLSFLVAGNRGRMLDPRRTPISIARILLETGFATIRIEGFEDVGASWDVPLEDVHHYQFTLDARRAPADVVTEMQGAIERFDRELVIEASEDDRIREEARVLELQIEVDAWLNDHSAFLDQVRALPDPSTRRGDEILAADLEAFMRQRGLWEVEAAFATQFVSNPGAGEIVKGHRIVLATLGLATYEGKVVRDPATFAGIWSRERRADHIRARLAFMRALFARLGVQRVSLWRGLAGDGPLRTGTRRTFVSTSFAEVVARSHFESGAERVTRVLQCQVVPVDRLFMTYLETGAMNDRFLEAEAALLARSDDGWP